MVFPTHYLMQFGGPAYNGTEQWSCNIRFAYESLIPVPLDAQEVADDLMEYMQERFSNTANQTDNPGFGICSSSSLEFVKFNEIGPDGKYTNPSETAAAYTTATPGYSGGTAPAYPPQVAAVVSWRTDVSRGPGSKGRIYLPSPEIPILAATGVASGTMPSAIARAWAIHLAQFQNIVSLTPGEASWYPSVVSQVGGGSASTIRRVLVGNVLDTQRRRRNELTEVYQSDNVSY